jgi:GntR family transcriptional regulator
LPVRQLVRAAGPLYRQLAAILRRSIADGSYPAGAALPKEAEIAGRFGISLITVRQALRDLESDGLIRKRASKPAVVTGGSPKQRVAGVVRNFADIAAYASDARLDVRSSRRERSAVARKAFDLAAGEQCYCLRAILTVEGRPDTQITTWFPPDIGRRLGRADFDDVLIFRAVEKHLRIRIAGAQITVRAEIADAAMARDLDYVEGGAILTTEMLYRSTDDRAVELTIGRHRADVFTLGYEARNEGL